MLPSPNALLKGRKEGILPPLPSTATRLTAYLSSPLLRRLPSVATHCLENLLPAAGLWLLPQSLLILSTI